MDSIYQYILQKETDRGLFREKNEDAVLALVHPRDDRYKLLAVADGMGGKNYGDVASNYVLKEFGYWFLSQPLDHFSDASSLSQELSNKAVDLNNYFIETYGKNQVGTTLSLALITLEQTIILQLGDSRVYFFKNQTIKQITEDDSDVWLYYKYHEVKKEELRYFSSSNVIHNCIGIAHSLCRPATFIYDNDSYEDILLFTDGVTDLVTDHKLNTILREYPKSQVLKTIIHEAVYVDQELFIPTTLKEKRFDHYIVPVRGKDNASGVFFSKK